MANHKMNVKLRKATKENFEAIKAERDITSRSCDEYMGNVYARTVFNVFYPLNPIMVEVKTAKRVSFREAFGDSFDKIDNGMRNMLAGLMEGGIWEYEFEECVITVEGEVLELIRLSKLCGGGIIARKP